MPSVLSASSTPSHFERSQRPATSAACAWGTLRAWASSNAMVCSAAERMLDCGALTTMTPAEVAASTSTLSRPMPARPTTTRSVPAASTSAVTVVAERMIRACAPLTASSSSSGLRPVWTSTSWPASRRRSSPESAIFSATSTRAMSAIFAVRRANTPNEPHQAAQPPGEAVPPTTPRWRSRSEQAAGRPSLTATRRSRQAKPYHRRHPDGEAEASRPQAARVSQQRGAAARRSRTTDDTQMAKPKRAGRRPPELQSKQVRPSFRRRVR